MKGKSQKNLTFSEGARAILP